MAVKGHHSIKDPAPLSCNSELQGLINPLQNVSDRSLKYLYWFSGSFICIKTAKQLLAVIQQLHTFKYIQQIQTSSIPSLWKIHKNIKVNANFVLSGMQE